LLFDFEDWNLVQLNSARRVRLEVLEAPRIRPIRLDRPLIPNSSAITRSALSEAMKFTRFDSLVACHGQQKLPQKNGPAGPGCGDGQIRG
jgi:hypothetical protein